MGRPLRIQYPGALYHITSRGNERKAIFKSKSDREQILSYLQSAHERYDAIIHVYCLMSNHYHLLLETPRSNLSQILHHINGAYTNYYNAKRKRVGHLFQGRYNAILVERDAYCKELSRYIHLNPVRAGLVEAPSRYHWSSYRYYIGSRKAPDWLTTDTVLGYFDTTLKTAKEHYLRFVEEAVGKDMENPLKDVFASTFLGSQQFIDWAKEKWIGFKNIDTRNVPPLRELRKRPSLDLIGHTLRSLKDMEDPFCKKLCLYISQQYGGYSLREIGDYYGMKGSAVSQSNRRLKDRISNERNLKKTLKGIIKELNLLNVEP